MALHYEQQRGASSGILVRDVLHVSSANVESYCAAHAPKSLKAARAADEALVARFRRMLGSVNNALQHLHPRHAVG